MNLGLRSFFTNEEYGDKPVSVLWSPTLDANTIINAIYSTENASPGTEVNIWESLSGTVAISKVLTGCSTNYCPVTAATPSTEGLIFNGSAFVNTSLSTEIVNNTNFVMVLRFKLTSIPGSGSEELMSLSGGTPLAVNVSSAGRFAFNGGADTGPVLTTNTWYNLIVSRVSTNSVSVYLDTLASTPLITLTNNSGYPTVNLGKSTGGFHGGIKGFIVSKDPSKTSDMLTYINNKVP